MLCLVYVMLITRDGGAGGLGGFRPPQFSPPIFQKKKKTEAILRELRVFQTPTVKVISQPPPTSSH